MLNKLIKFNIIFFIIFILGSTNIFAVRFGNTAPFNGTVPNINVSHTATINTLVVTNTSTIPSHIVSGTVTASYLVGNGQGITSLNATQLKSGTINTARVSGSYTGITGLGTISGTLTAGTFSGNGSSITSVNASELKSGTVPSARISGGYNGITSVGTLSSVSVSGIATASRVISTVAQGTAPLAVTSTTNVTNLNVDMLDGQHGSYYQDATNLNSGSLPAARIGTGLITSTMILDGTVASADIAVNAIKTNHIAVSAIGSSRIADGSVTGTDIASNTITSSNIASGAIKNGHLTAGSFSNITGVGTLSALTVSGTSNITNGVFSGSLKVGSVTSVGTGQIFASDAIYTCTDADSIYNGIWSADHMHIRAAFGSGVGGSSVKSGIILGSGTGGGDAGLYRDSAGVLRTSCVWVIDAGLNVGTATGAGTGQIRTSSTVGIGTNNPQGTLGVVGDVRITGNCYITNKGLGECYVSYNVTATNLVLNTYVTVTANVLSGTLSGITHSNGVLTIGANNAGYYFINCTGSLTKATKSDYIHLGLSINNNALPHGGMEIDLDTSDVNVLPFALTGIRLLNAGDTVRLKIENTSSSDDVTVNHMDLSIFRIQPL